MCRSERFHGKSAPPTRTLLRYGVHYAHMQPTTGTSNHHIKLFNVISVLDCYPRLNNPSSPNKQSIKPEEADILLRFTVSVPVRSLYQRLNYFTQASKEQGFLANESSYFGWKSGRAVSPIQSLSAFPTFSSFLVALCGAIRVSVGICPTLYAMAHRTMPVLGDDIIA
jgi:hypothetical protein